VLARHYSDELSQTFAAYCTTFNQPNARYFRPKKTP
jgi:hypothetical protein